VKLRQILSVGAAITAFVLSAAVPASAAPSGADTAASLAAPGGICAQGHFQDVGWEQGKCWNAGEFQTVDTPASGRALEALEFLVRGAGFCVNGHVQNIGWQGETCRDAGQNEMAKIGTVGQGLSLEAVSFKLNSPGTICAAAYVRGLGWLAKDCRTNGQYGTVGTIGQNRPIEAIMFLAS
jgi:hypothetical protein